jgi:type I restriction enzyme S subunit
MVSSMRKMKDSGVEWIGVIPEEWDVISHKHLMNKSKDICSSYNGENILSLTKQGVIVRDLENPSGKMPATFDGYQRVRSNNLLLCLFDIDVTPRCVGLIKNNGLTSPAYSQFVMKSGCLSEYYNYLLEMIDNEKSFLHLSKNLRSSLTETDFGFIKSIRPSIEEQLKIAMYLNEKLDMINLIVAKTKESIEEYKKYKQSLITETITKGLNPDVKMKDSRIEWIGEVPEHWEITIAKHVLQRLDRPRKQNGNTVICSNHGISKLLGDVSTGLVSETQHDYQGVEIGDLLIHGMDTWHGAIAVSEHEGDCTSVVHVCNTKHNKTFISYFLKMLAIMNVYKVISNGVRQNTSDFRSWKKAGDIMLLLPPINEQNQIAKFFDDKFHKIDSFICQKKIFIKELESYKKSLIYEVVTGKKEIN